MRLLKPSEECVDIPKEVCVRNRQNPRRVQKPLIKKWCYTPTPESGLPPAPRPPPPAPRPKPPPVTPRPGTNIPINPGNQGGNKNGLRPTGPTKQELPSCVRGYPATHCPQRAGNGRCDPECNTDACGFDGGDCTAEPPVDSYLPPPNSYLPPPDQAG